MFISSKSKSTEKHKFFYKTLDINLNILQKFLMKKLCLMESGKIFDSNLQTYNNFEYVESISTKRWNQYNVFQFYDQSIYDLYIAVAEITKEACEYYKKDFYKQRYMIRGWFNVNKKNTKTLDWHEHANEGCPLFHGYYCVNAEPSQTTYKIFDRIQSIENKNNVAILSETGHPHCVSEWNSESPRITVAYDVVPLNRLFREQDQHWIPLR